MNYWQQLQARIRAMPVPKPEDSILFRVLTQALVSVGILATDLAADTQIGLWAIPLSAIGASWSWWRRRKQNVGFKFLLAIAMTIALFALFARMFGSGLGGDNRLLLAEFLIQMQVLHSFDLPRRKDLGYSMIIGLVLLSVASTLSQTMSFGIMLLVFLAIALPVLMLDYCSRLGVDVVKLERTSFRKVNFRVLPAVFAGILALGLVLFAIMPRLPSAQLRVFPVNAPANVQQAFGDRAIATPGYGRSGTPQAGLPGAGGQANVPKGESDDESYAGFGDRMNQNLRGNPKPQIVMRVRSQIEGFWRVRAFDRYTGQGWEVSRDKTETIRRSAWSYRFSTPTPITLNKTREVIQTYTIVSELPNLIPALSVPKEVYFPTQEIAIDTEGSLRSPGGLPVGMTYSVVSEVPYRDRTRLRMGSTFVKYPANSPHLQIPANISGRVANQTQKILATAQTDLKSDYEKALYLGQYLKQRYKLQPELPLLNKDEDLVEAFLFKHQGGFRDHFSTTFTLMLRSIGIPARLVVGFAPGQFNPFTGLYIVRTTDAYAMTEMFIPKLGWFAIDPTPGHELIPPSIEEYQPFSVLRSFWRWVAGWLPSPLLAILSEIIRLIGSAIAGFIGLFAHGLVGFFTACIILISLGFLGWISVQGWQIWRDRRRLRKLQPMERLYQQMLTVLSLQGLRKHPAQTPFEYAQQAQKNYQHDRAETIRSISQAYVKWRYGGQLPDLQVLQQKLRILKRKQKS